MARLWFSLRFALLGGFVAVAAVVPARAQNAAAAPLRPKPADAGPAPGRSQLPLEAPPVTDRAAPTKPGREPLVAPPVGFTPELIALIEQLGHDSFVSREAASAKLAAVGMVAKPALQQALKNSDPEVRLRARRLLGQIQAADVEARLKAFVADTAGRQEHDLPGWPRYRKLVGESQAARKLFADMHRAEPGLMETSSGGGDVAAECLQMRTYHLLRTMQQGYATGRTGGPPLGAVAALLFVAGDERAKVSDTTQMQVYNFIQQQPFQQALRDGSDGEQAKRLLGGWVSRQTGLSTAQIAIQMAVQWDLKEGAVTARRVLADKGTSVYVRASAAVALGKLGGKEDLKLLVEMLADKTPCGRRTVIMADGKRTEHNTELRDVALAALVHLTGQKFDDYGLKITTNPQTFFNYGQVHFPSPEAREAALKKWNDWAAKNPLEVTKRAEAKPEKTAEPATRIRIAGGGFVFAGPGVVMVSGNGEKADDKPTDELPFYVADREAGQRLARARQLIEEGQFAPALRVLDAILGQAEERSFQPEIGRPLYQSLRIEAQRLLRLLPDEGRRAYELLVGNQARRELEEAVTAGDVARLEQVVRRYLPSAAGQEAALLMGDHLLDRGRPLAAAVVLSALREHDHERRFEPLLSLRIAHSWLSAGMPQEARAALRQMKAPPDELDNIRNSLEFVGRRLPPLDNVEGIFAALSDLAPIQPSSTAQASDWTVFRGDARRNAAADGRAPWLHGRWRAETANTQAARDSIASLTSAYRQERLSALPTGHPLAVGDTVLARTTGELLALDVKSGAIQWRVPLTDAVDDLMVAQGAQAADNNALLRGLDERVWNDLTYGTLASDGRYVYLVEDVGLVHGLSAERMVVQADGSRRLDAGWPGENNRLTAYDLRTGKFRWEIGGPRGEFQLDLAGACFLGPPLPLAGKLYVVAEADERICLLSLDPGSGKLLERFPLAVLDQSDGTRQFNAYVPLPLGRPSRRLSGASPAYAGGVMICPTSWNSFTAVDVGSGAILWSYRPMRLEENGRPNANMMIFGLAQSPGGLDDALRRDDRWADCSATIAGERVLVTPRENGRLLCLDLRSGRLLWEAPRGDAQYVAAVTGRVRESLRDSHSRLGETRPRDESGDVALLVGRSSLRGLRMADGKPAWETLALPAGAAPSGRGYLSDGRYYLPLASAEVAVIDLAAGRLLHRAKSADGRVPGNLVCAKDHVISQGAEGIESYPRLDGVIGPAALAAGKRPSDPAALAEYGRMLLSRGDYVEAISHLRRSLELRKDDATRTALCDAVLQALEADFPAQRQTAVDLAAVFKEADQQVGYLRAMAVGLRRAGEHPRALESLLELAGQMVEPAREPRDGHASRVSHDLQPVSAVLYARGDVWLRGQLADLRAACPLKEQAEMDRRIGDRLAKAIESKNPDTLRKWLTLLGDHPRTLAARDALLARYFDLATGKLLDAGMRPLEVERLLIEMQAGPDVDRSRAATAGLARFLAVQGRPEEAAVLYRRLNGELAQVICQSGKTGKQLFAELPADSPVRRVLGAPGAWPQGVVEKQTAAGTATRIVPTTWPLNVEAARNSLFDELRIEVTANVSPQRIIARDLGGNERWNVELRPPDGGNFGVSAQTLRAKLDGHLLCVWQGNRVFVIDTLATEAKRPGILWSKDLTTKFPGLDGGPGYAQQMVFFAGGGVPVFASTDTLGRPVAEIGPLTGRLLCYQGLRTLTAVDPVTGDALWSRHDVPRGCELLGDGEILLALPRDGTTADGTRALVLRATDGHELGRCEVPDKRDRLAVLGRHVVTWTGNDERQTLRLLDPWHRRDVWTREFPGGSKLARIGPNEAGRHEVGVLDPQGNFSVLSLADGALRVSTALKAPANLLDIHVLRSQDRYLLLAKQSLAALVPAAAPDKPAEKIVYPLSLGGQVEMVSGTLYGFDRASGGLQWQTAIDQRGLDLSQSAHWPILVLAERVYYQGENAPRRYETKVTCLDKRDGRVVFEETSPLTSSQLQVVPDAASHSVEVRTGRSTTKLVFTGKPLPAK